MLKMMCQNEVDCNIASTRILDLLQLSAVSNSERVQAVYVNTSMGDHVTLRVQLENGAFVYFNGGREFLPANFYDGRFLQAGTSWQIMAGNLSDLAESLKSGNPDGAIVKCREALAIDPKSAFVHLNLGVALENKGDLDGAIAEYRKALEIDPMYAFAHNNLGNALDKKGDLDGAIAEYREALAIDPMYAFAHSNLGDALFDKNDLDGAIAEYRKALALEKNITYIADIHYELGSALRKQGKLDEAIAEFREVLKINPKDADAIKDLNLLLEYKAKNK